MSFSSDCLKDITIRVLNGRGETVGAGFMLDEAHAVTCAHVISDAHGQRGGEVEIAFYDSSERYLSKVSSDFWSAADEDDVAILTLPEKCDPKLIPPLHKPSHTTGHDYVVLGFPDFEDREVVHVLGKLADLVPLKTKRQRVLQLDGEKIFRGMSGAAVFDVTAESIVGMLSEYLVLEDGTKLAYATTMDVIGSVYHALQKKDVGSPILVDYAYQLSEKLEMVKKKYQNWGYDMKSLTDIDQLGVQMTGIYDAVSVELGKFPDHRSKMTLDGLIRKSAEDFKKLKGALFVSVLNSSNEEPIESEIQKSLSSFSNSVQRLVELLK